MRPDCGNAPKKAQVRDWLIALASSESGEVTRLLDADVRWEHVGDETWTGIDDVAARLPSEPAELLQISRLLSHGKEVAAEGRLVPADGPARRFAHLLRFTGHGKNAKLASITTYSVEAPDQAESTV